MPYNRKKFVEDMKNAYPKIPELERHFAYLYYANALSQADKGGITIGLLPNIRKEVKELGSIFDSSAGRMCVGDGWKIHYNDAFILGGIHGHSDYKLVGLNKWISPGGPDDKGSQLVPEEGAKKNVVTGYSGVQLDYVSENMIPVSYGCLKVTQREVAALNMFGYKGTDDDGSRIFTCSNTASADQATMVKYVEHVKVLQKAIAG